MGNDLDAVIDSIAGKIDRIELSADEAAVLDALLTAAGAPPDGEVDGYSARKDELGFALPDMRARMKQGLIAWGGDVASLFPSRNIVINHEEQY